MGADIIGDLGPALLINFGIIFIGYVCGRAEIIPVSMGGGIGKFVGTLSLPSLLFRSMATLNLSSVNYKVIVGILLGKMSAFWLVVLCTRLFDDWKPGKIGHAGLRGIFVTQSNDFALALPIIDAIFSPIGKDHYVDFVYLVAPIQLVIINPIGLVLMEYGLVQTQVADTCAVDFSGDSKAKGVNYGAIFKRIVRNPVVFMTFLGLVANFALGSTLPGLPDAFLSTLGQAFAPCSLFLLGHAMVGRLGAISAPKLILPMALIMTKTLVLATLCFFFVSLLGGTDNLKLCAFIIGSIPTAPSVLLFAQQYNISPDKTAISMVLCTALGAPIMFMAAQVQAMSGSSSSVIEQDVKAEIQVLSVLSLVGTLWVLVVLGYSRKFSRASRFRYLYIMIACQCAFALGGSVCLADPRTAFGKAVKYGFALFFQYATFGWGAAMAFHVPFKLINGFTDEAAAEKMDKWYHCFVWSATSIATAISVATASKYDSGTCFVQFETSQIIVNLVFLVVCLAVNALALIGIRKSIAKERQAAKADISLEDVHREKERVQSRADIVVTESPLASSTSKELEHAPVPVDDDGGNEQATRDKYAEEDDEVVEDQAIEGGTEMVNISLQDNSSDSSAAQSSKTRRTTNEWSEDRESFDNQAPRRSSAVASMDVWALLRQEKHASRKIKLGSKSGYQLFVMTLVQLIILFFGITLGVWALATSSSNVSAGIGMLLFLYAGFLTMQGVVTTLVFGMNNNEPFVDDLIQWFKKRYQALGWRSNIKDSEKQFYKPESQCNVSWDF